MHTYVYSLIADSSDKGSDSGQKKSNIESEVTLQILSTVDSTGTNISAHSLAVFSRHGHRPKWSFRPS